MRILPLLLALSLGTAGAAAQSGGRPKTDEPRFDGETPRKDDLSSGKAEVTPEKALEKALPLITTWPAEGGEAALRALIVRGPDVMVPLLRARLAGGTVLERSAAARGLCLLGDRESFEAIERLFSDARQRRRFTALLASLHELDAARAQALALRFLESDQAPLRLAATALLKSHPTPDLRAALRRRLLESRRDAERVDVFSLLESLKDAELPGLALEHFLGHASPQLAARATYLLSWQESPEIRRELVRLARSSRERRGLHAALALALAEQRLGAALLPDDLFDTLLPTIRTSDKLLRATSCIVCGMVGYRREGAADLVQDQVLPALADAVVNSRFFGDFELCFNAQVRTLELLTGEKLGSSVPAWRSYFEANAEAPVKGRRELKAFVLEEDVASAVVTVAPGDAAGRLTPAFALCGPALRFAVSMGRRPGSIALPAAEMRSLLEELEKEGLLTAEIPRAFETPTPGGVQLTVEARGRERTVALAPGEPRLAAFQRAIRRAAEAQWWQLLLPAGPDHARTYAEEQAWFDTHPDPAARRGRLVDLALAQLGGSDGGGSERAFDVLTRIDSLGQSVRADQVDAIAALLSRLQLSDWRSRRLFDLLVATGRADAFDRLVEALAPRGAQALPWITEAVLATGRVTAGLGDPRAAVRLAALAAAEQSGADLPPEERLIALATEDPDPGVRARGLALLARSGGGRAVATLIGRATAADGDARGRADALRALGGVQQEDALAVLAGAARGGEGSLAAAAIEGLSRRGDESAAAALDGLVRERGPADPIGRLALSAIKGLPRELAVARLERLHAEGEGAVAREAAYGLADLGEMGAVGVLLDDLEDPRLQRRAQTLLTYLFCQDLGTESWRFRSLHESQPFATHADHFVAALRESGALVRDDEDPRDPASVPVLVAAIEDSRWFVRRSALEYLEAVTGRGLGTLSVDSGKEEIADLARRWREATTTQARGDEPQR